LGIGISDFGFVSDFELRISDLELPVSPALVSLLTFVAGVLAVLGVYSILSDLFLRDRSRVSRRVDEEFRQRQRNHIRKSSLFKDLESLARDLSAEEKDEALSPRQRFEVLVEQSGLNLAPGRLLLIAGVVGLTVGALGLLLRESLVAGIITGLAGAAVPLLYVHGKRRARLNRLLGQLPDAFELMARIVRAGQTTAQALQAVADEFEPPLAAEFAYCYEQQNLGLPPETALRDLARRTGLLEIKILVLSLLVQQQTGGNLAQLLENLAGVVRERLRLAGKIKALTAEGRLQGAILLALPPLLFLLMLVVDRNYAQILLGHPHLLAGTGISMGIGAVWIRRIVRFDY
jgi:tight adherence protein B